LITEANLKRNPIYPFADYFWAWHSSHTLIFRVLAASLPEADISHAVSTGFAGLVSYAAKVRRNKPLLLTEHGLYHKEREMEIRKSGLIRGYQRDMWITLYNLTSKICYRQADLTTALFEENRGRQIDFGAPPERTMVLPNGIDIERFSITRKEREGFHVGLVGRVVPIKDIKTFITAAKIVLEEVPEARFYCIGPTDEDSAYYEDCKLLVQSMKIADKFEFTGRKNVLEYYEFLNVMVLTSVKEAQPLVILEAYCAGIPVVSTRVGNVAEMMDYEEKLMASSKDAAGVAEGILYLRRNPAEVKRLVEKNALKVRTLHDKKTLLERMRAIYLRLHPGDL
jgi:glycosyltransferase involved in cell wall biosynthesis